MQTIPNSASAKAILFGEHAVVYGQPAIALPVSSARTKVLIRPGIGLPAGEVLIKADALELDTTLDQLPPDHPIRISIQETLQKLDIQAQPSYKMTIQASFPLRAGLGGSASISVAIARSLSNFLGHPLSAQDVNDIAFLCEASAHGKPSGIDNTVISLEQPIYYEIGNPAKIITPGKTLHFLLADTGMPKSTASLVRQLSERIKTDDTVMQIIPEIGEISRAGLLAFEAGNSQALGHLMGKNQDLLSALGLSSPALDALIDVATKNGAYGAKLTGAGRGGCVLILLEEGSLEALKQNLLDAGARTLIPFKVSPA